MAHTFILDEKESKLASEFIASKKLEYTGAIGGQFTYEFTPTSIGLIVGIYDQVSKERLDLTDWEKF